MIVSNIIGCAGSVILILSASVWLPFFGPFFSLLTPLPFLFYSSKLGRAQGLKIGLITLLIVGLLARITGQPQLILLCLEFGIAGLIISEIFKREITFGLTIFWGTVLMLFVGATFLLFIGLSKGMGPAELLLTYLKASLDEAINIYESQGLDEAALIQLKEYTSLLKDVIVSTYPALLIVGSGFIIWLNVVISKPLFLKGGIKYPDLGRTDMWNSPEYMVWGVIAAGFYLFLPLTGLKFIALNVLIVLSAIYAFHGLSIVMFFFNRHRIPKWIRFGIYLLIIIQQMFLIILAFLGLFDQWIDFRKIHKKSGEIN
jgi:uncharacterized protein YybS (DUF2232 family)